MPTPQRYDLTYDYADQLTNAPLKKATNNALIRQYTYGYDLGSNRTSEQVGNASTTSVPNDVNEITSQSGATNRTLSYDLNGSLTSDGGTRTFEWDGANRLVAINYTGTTQRTEFIYDGLSHCVKLVEKNGNTTVSTRRFLWCGNDRCEFRNNNGAVQYQLFAHGQYQNNATYFYTRDHLGSIREMTDASGTVVARYDYDPWGRSTTVIGTNKPDFNFTGLYQHAKSGLDMAVYRFYDPDLGRWLNRDPVEERGGVNLYRYVNNDPISKTDLSGLSPWYGNYCGPGNRPGPPANCVDTACKRHDDCYAKCGVAGLSGALLGNACSRACDRELCRSLKSCKMSCRTESLARSLIYVVFCD